MSVPILYWVLFNLFILAMLALDMGVFHRDDREMKVSEAMILSMVWVILSFLFNAGIYFWMGRTAAIQFFTAYLIEKSLSVDNLFVFVMIFSYFNVAPRYQHRILFWGIIGAQIMRAIFIIAGIALIQMFHWIFYVFGAFLIFTGIKMMCADDTKQDIGKNWVIRLLKKWMPVTEEYHGKKFFVKIKGRRYATPLFVVLLMIETTDLIFAIDSIPAVMGISLDPFIVYTSNVFAILGLRAMYFALAGTIQKFHYLRYGISLILVFIGAKMLVEEHYLMPIGLTLGVIGSLLLASVGASLLWPKRT